MFERVSWLLNLKNILLLALILRLIVAPLGAHGDADQYYWWGMDLWNKGFLGFYDRNIDNAVRPNYSPVIIYLLWAAALIHELLWQIFWFLNQHLPLFPGRVIFWLESSKGWYFLNKLPAIFADLGIILLLFKFGNKFTPKKISYTPALLFALVPAFWYNSALWGQTDSIFGFLMLAAFYSLYTKRIILSAFLYSLAFLTKPVSMFAFPVFAVYWLINSDLKKTIQAVLLCSLFAILIHLPFHPDDFFAWAAMFYGHNLGGQLAIITANSFNSWALIYGFSNTADTVSFLGLPANLVGYGVFAGILVVIILGVLKNRQRIPFEKVLLFASLLSYAAFMFLPRMHERYFYPVLVLLLPLVGADKRIKNLFLGLSTIHLINLYHYFWVPRVDFLIAIFTNPMIEKLLIITNLVMFFMLARYSFQKSSK